jgi:hypothetical protein
MNYYYAKIGEGNCLATDFLNGTTPINRPAIPLFFNKTPANREHFERDGQAKEQGANFFWCSDNPDQSRIVIINDGRLYVAKPTGPVEFWKSDRDLGYATVDDYIKLLPIKIICEKRLAEVPGILSSMTANAYYYTGTFRRISDPGNILALQSVLDIPLNSCESTKDLLMCLSSIELETLVAKMFEEKGCFVPAYRGGAIKDIDIFAKNIRPITVTLHKLVLRPGETKSIQVKRHTALKEPPAGCDALISAEADADWIVEVIATLATTKSWLKESLSWVGPKTLQRFGIC